MDSKARAHEAKEEKAKENATTADQPDISRESSPIPTRAGAKAKDSKKNATTAEKLDIQSANAPNKKEMQRELAAREDTKELGAKEDSTEKAKESGK